MRRALKILAGLIVSLIAVIVAIIALVPTEKIAQIAADQVKAATGREVRLIGDISPSFYPILGMETGAISIANAEWGQDEHLLTASATKIGVELMPLLSGQIRISEIRLTDPVLSLEIDESGVGNWAVDGAAASTEGGAESFIKELNLDDAVIRNGVIRFNDRVTGRSIELSDLDAAASLPALDAAFSMRGSAVWNGEATSLDLALTTPAAVLNGGAFELKLELSAQPLSLAFDGRVDPSAPLPAVTGAFAASAASPGGAMAWALGAPAPAALAELSDISLSGDLRMDATGASVDAKGGATRNGVAARVSLKAAGGSDWADTLAFDIDAAAEAPGLASASFDGRLIVIDGAPLPIDLNGDYRISSPNPAKAVGWATGAAPAAIEGVTDLSVAGAVAASAKGLAATAKGAAARNGARVGFDLKASGGGDWLNRRAFDVSLDAAIGEFASASYAGSAAFPGSGPKLDGRLTLAAPDLRGLAAFAGAALPKAGDGAYKSLQLSAAVSTPGANAIRLDGAKIRFDDIDAAGSVEARYGGALSIAANLKTSVLRIRRYMAGGGSGPAGPGWSKERIDLSSLGGASADIALRADGVLLPNGLRLDRSDITAKLRGGKLDLTIREIGVYGGGLAGSATVDGRNGNAIRADVAASAVQLLPMLKALADMRSVEGLGRVKLAVSGQGGSMHAIMNSLSGNGSMKLTDGALVGYNLAAMVRNVTNALSGGGSSQRTDFSEVSGTFKIRKGVLSNADFKFLGPLIRIVGAGSVDLGGQTMNFRLTPRAVASLTGQGGSVADKGIAFPVVVSGPWSNLSFRPDLEAGLKGLLTDPEGALKSITDAVGGGSIKDIVKGATGGGGDILKKAIGGAVGAAGAKTVIDKIAPKDSGLGGAAKKLLDGVTGGKKGAAKKKKAANQKKRNAQKKRNKKKNKKKNRKKPAGKSLNPEMLLKDLLKGG